MGSDGKWFLPPERPNLSTIAQVAGVASAPVASGMMT
jgi:hypothetical protein